MRRQAPDHFAGLDRPPIVVLATAIAAFVAVVVGSSWADRQHSALRDPLSYFGSDAAPAPTLFAVSLGILGAAISWIGYRWLPKRLGVGLVVVGVSAALLALLPLDCSPVDDVCEVVIRAGADSASHDLHGYVGFVLHLAVVATSGAAARLRPFGMSPVATAGAFTLVLASLLPLVLIAVRPFGVGLGASQVVGFSAAGLLALVAGTRFEGDPVRT